MAVSARLRGLIAAGALVAAFSIGYLVYVNGDAVMIDPQMKEKSRQLCDAARVGDLVGMRRLLEAGASPNPVWDADEAAREHQRRQEELHASMAEHLAKLNLPEETIAETSFPNDLLPAFDAPSDFEIPLFCAAEGGSVECLELLLKTGAGLHQRDWMGHTALFDAGSPEVARSLIDAGIDRHAADKGGDDALSKLLDDLSGENEQTHDRIIATCNALIQAGIPVVRSRPGWGNSRLYDAAFRENLHAVKFLLDAGHPIDADQGTTALHAICWHWDYGDERDEVTRAIVRTLLLAGISPHVRNSDGNSPLHEALSGDGSNLVAAEELLAAGADINAVNNDSVTPLLLHYETQFDYERVVPFMLERGANPLIADRRGQTVIDAARRMIEGGQPMWRVEMAEAEGEDICGWKGPAETGDAEHRMLALLENAAAKFSPK